MFVEAPEIFAVTTVVRDHTHTSVVYESLPDLPERYEPLFSHSGRTSMFFTLPWYRNFIQSVLAPDERLRVYAVDTSASPEYACAVLLMRYRILRAGWLGTRTLNGLTNYYTSLFGPVVGPAQRDIQGTLDTLATAIARDTIRWDVVDLRPLATDPPVFPGLIAAFRNSGMLVQTFFCFGNWYLQVRGRSYAEYFGALPSQLRNTVGRKKKQFDKSPKSRIVVYHSETGLDEGLNAYEKIYASSWKIPEPYPGFIRGLCYTCARSGWLRLGVAFVDDQPAAAQIWIINEGIANIYKLAYDEKYAKLSLGSILTAYLMEQAIDVDKVHEVDYLTGDDSYKKDWMSDRRERWGIIAFNLRTPRGLLTGMWHLGRQTAKRAIDAVRRLRVPGDE